MSNPLFLLDLWFNLSTMPGIAVSMPPASAGSAAVLGQVND
jgi:hypothetical protein